LTWTTISGGTATITSTTMPNTEPSPTIVLLVSYNDK
jgi:hypothetical protein